MLREECLVNIVVPALTTSSSFEAAARIVVGETVDPLPLVDLSINIDPNPTSCFDGPSSTMNSSPIIESVDFT